MNFDGVITLDRYFFGEKRGRENLKIKGFNRWSGGLGCSIAIALSGVGIGKIDMSLSIELRFIISIDRLSLPLKILESIRVKLYLTL